MAAHRVNDVLILVSRTAAGPHQVEVRTAFVLGQVPALRRHELAVSAFRRVDGLLFRINEDAPDVGRTDVVEAGHVRTLDRGEVFAGTHLRHMAGFAAVAAVRTALREEVGGRGVAVLAVLLQVRNRVLAGPVVGRNFVRVMAGRAAHALLIVLRVVRLRTFGTASRAEALEVGRERSLGIGLSVFTVVDEALVAAFAVGRHAGTAGRRTGEHLRRGILRSSRP